MIFLGEYIFYRPKVLLINNVLNAYQFLYGSFLIKWGLKQFFLKINHLITLYAYPQDFSYAWNKESLVFRRVGYN